VLNELASPTAVRRSLPRTLNDSIIKPNYILQPDEASDLLLAYATGATMAELAHRYGGDSATVQKHVELAGALRRAALPALETNQVAQAAVLYVWSWSTNLLTALFDVSQNAMYRAMERAGIVLRPWGSVVLQVTNPVVIHWRGDYIMVELQNRL
jgi:hypothetical protein